MENKLVARVPLINFMDPLINPYVTCNMPHLDDYPPTNLINKSLTSDNGFMADYYIKPPVSLLLLI